jgi:FKBP-type peptidyl-prolyl cis-trans isomerase SlyD
MSILLGAGNIIPGLESAMAGREAGDRFDVTVTPEQAYGERRDDFTQRVPKKYFEHAQRLKSGMTTLLKTQDGSQRMVVVMKIGQSVIDVDLNHPMAGKTLNFAVEILDVRVASEEEIAHGHAHAQGGHQH